MEIDNMRGKVFDNIFWFLLVKLTKLVKFGLNRLMYWMNRYSGYSVKSNPSKKSDINVEKQSGESGDLPLNKHKLVLKVTYVTWLHMSNKNNENKITSPKTRAEIWIKIISKLNFRLWMSSDVYFLKLGFCHGEGKGAGVRLQPK